MINIYNKDCLEAMKEMSDNQFDLAIVDPPYGIDMDGGNIGGNNLTKAKDYTKKDWDKSAPSREYFIELKRVSKNQIIWGANHFIQNIPKANSSCWIVWDKDNTGNFADCELAYTSFKSAVRKYKFRWNGMLQGDMKNKEQRIHPTQKPVKLYEWLLMNYSKEGDKILDTHLGSGSIAIACHNLGYDLEGYELDKEYYDNALKRIKEHQSQLKLI
jgi:site-specific DNA-methyltransferase (adenine-specific)